MQVTGFDLCLQNLQMLRDKTEVAVQTGVTQSADWIHKRSLYYAPEDTSAMKKDSRSFTVGEGFKTKSVVAYNFTGATPYAIYVHEDLTKHHELPTSAKFLERAYNDAVADSDFRSIVGNTFKNLMGRMRGRP